MSTQRIVIHLVSVALLLIWGGVMLYFYASGRIVNYLPPISEGWFRPMALAGGIGLIILGIFNLATMGSDDAGCDDCGHDHGHDHDHSHDHAHKHGDDCWFRDNGQPAVVLALTDWLDGAGEEESAQGTVVASGPVDGP